MKQIVSIVFSILLIVTLAFTSFAAGWTQDSTGSWYYYDESGNILKNTTTPDGYKVGVDGKWVDENSGLPSMAKAFGFERKSIIQNLKNLYEDRYNCALSFMNGDWDYSTSDGNGWSENCKIVPMTYNTVMGAFVNQDISTTRNNSRYYVATHNITPIFSRDEFMNQQVQAYNKALEIYKSLHNSGRIRTNMTQYEKCQVLSDYWRSTNISPGATNNRLIGNDRTVYMKYDSAYAALVNKVADCCGRSAGFNVLLNMEGIKAFGLSVRIKGVDSGHVVSYAILDGKEYAIDPFSNKLCEIGSNQLNEWATVDSKSLEAARVASSF